MTKVTRRTKGKPITAHEQTQLYLALMSQIKARYYYASELLAFSDTRETTLTDFQSACLQLRLIYEEIGFSALTAEAAKLAEVDKDLSSEWKFSLIVKELKKINPHCFPRAMKMTRSSGAGVDWELSDRIEAGLSIEDLIYRHGFLGNYLHASNPLKPFTDVSTKRLRISSWLKEVRALLELHV